MLVEAQPLNMFVNAQKILTLHGAGLAVPDIATVLRKSSVMNVGTIFVDALYSFEEVATVAS